MHVGLLLVTACAIPDPAIKDVHLQREAGQAWGLQLSKVNTVSKVEPNGPARKAGLAEGDTVLSVDGYRTDEPESAAQKLKNAGRNAHLHVRSTQFSVAVSCRTGPNAVGITLHDDVVKGVKAGSPAENAGLAIGDKLLSLDGKSCSGRDCFASAIRTALHAGCANLEFQVYRPQHEGSLTIEAYSVLADVASSMLPPLIRTLEELLKSIQHLVDAAETILECLLQFLLQVGADEVEYCHGRGTEYVACIGIALLGFLLKIIAAVATTYVLIAWPGHQIVAVAVAAVVAYTVWTYGFVWRFLKIYLAQPHRVICSLMLMRLTPSWLPFAARARPLGAAARGSTADDCHKMVQARLCKLEAKLLEMQQERRHNQKRIIEEIRQVHQQFEAKLLQALEQRQQASTGMSPTSKQSSCTGLDETDR